MLRSEIKESIIMLAFIALLAEFLTPLTMGFVFFGVMMVLLKIKLHKYVRNIIALIVFGSYWFSYGKVIDPEVGLNFLTTIITIKMLEKETLRDRYMIFFGLILVIGAGSLFVRSILYVGFFSTAFFVLIQDFYQALKLNWKFKEAGSSLLWVLPLTAIFFFFIPRVMNPFSYQSSSRNEGEIGYTPEVNLSDVESITSNESPVFRAVLSKKVSQVSLYWRGNTLSFTDGWNWPILPQDRTDPSTIIQKEYVPDPNGILQIIRLYGKDEFYFGLDTPATYIFGDKILTPGEFSTLGQRKWQSSLRYKVVSLPAPEMELKNNRKFTYHSLDLEAMTWIKNTFKATDSTSLKTELKKYFTHNGFSYTLSPGKVKTFLHFMQEKKAGFCSHYASALALILRAKGIPARLVSGFMGGSYNTFADFYLITQNDAHVWVEVYDQGAWTRLDPTSWIAPERILSGGEAFVEAEARALGRVSSQFKFGFLHDFQQWFDQWDFRFYQWLEEMDYYGQETLLEKLMIKKEWFFTLAPLMLVLFMGLYAWFLYGQKQKAFDNQSVYQKLWREYSRKVEKRGLILPLTSLKLAREALERFEHSEKKELKEIFETLVNLTFSSSETECVNQLHREIKRL